MDYLKTRFSFLKNALLLTFFFIATIVTCALIVSDNKEDDSVYAYDLNNYSLIQNGGIYNNIDNSYQGSNNSYMSFNQSFQSVYSKVWEIQIMFTYYAGSSHPTFWGSVSDRSSPVFLIENGVFYTYLSSTGSSWDYFLISNLAPTSGSTYCWRIGYDGLGFYMKCKTLSNPTQSLFINDWITYVYYYYENANVSFQSISYIGNHGYSLSGYYTTSIFYLNNCYVSFNNQIVWNGELHNKNKYQSDESLDDTYSSYAINNIDSYSYCVHYRFEYDFNIVTNNSLYLRFYCPTNKVNVSNVNFYKQRFFYMSDRELTFVKHNVFLDISIYSPSSSLSLSYNGNYQYLYFGVSSHYLLVLDLYVYETNTNSDLSFVCDMQPSFNDFILFNNTYTDGSNEYYTYLYYWLGHFFTNLSNYNYFNRDNPYFSYSQATYSVGSTRYFVGSASNTNITNNSSCYFYMSVSERQKIQYTVKTSFYFEDLVFYINADTFLINNALVVYNYSGYNNFSNVFFELSLNSQPYYIYLTKSSSIFNNVGDYTYFYNESLRNIQFDKYIKVHFKGSFLNYNYKFLDEFDSINTVFSGLYGSFGFDFNFQKYTAPLQSVDYNNYFQNITVDYVDMPFHLSIIPPELYIPFKEIFYNVMIFFMFHCPIVSDILAWTHLTDFLGALVFILGIFQNGLFGDMLFGIIAFFIFFAIIRSWVPTSFASFATSSIGSNASGFGSAVRSIKKENQARKDDDTKNMLRMRVVRQGRVERGNAWVKSQKKKFKTGKVYDSSVKNLKGRSRLRVTKKVRGSYKVSKPKYASREDIIRIAKENGMTL